MKTQLFFFLLMLNSGCWAQTEPQHVIQQLIKPQGFNITLYADNVPNARTLALGDDGIIYVGTRQQGSVYAVQDLDGDGVAENKYVLATGLNMPNGVAYRNHQLFVAEVDRIIRFDDIDSRLTNPPKPVVIYDQLPSDKHHGWKYLRFGPDGKLYSAVGAPCNICLPDKPIYGTLIRMNPDGSDMEILASGIRNTVGYDWQPQTGELYFTENGRDYLGDDQPPDELNLWQSKGQHFGYPFCHGGFIADPEFGSQQSCDQFTQPQWRFKAHMAPLGLRFYTGDQFPARFHNQLLVAQHGSWNRSKPHGYRIALVKFKNNKPYQEQAFISGWLTADDKVLGRPTDILQLPDGSILITDDNLGVIYRVSYHNE